MTVKNKANRRIYKNVQTIKIFNHIYYFYRFGDRIKTIGKDDEIEVIQSNEYQYNMDSSCIDKNH